jgi:osmotically-inducible protein OsmY
MEEVQHDSLGAVLDEATTEIDVQLALLNNLGVDGLRVDTDVIGNRVVLTGTVHDPASQELADDVAASLPGVDEVDNRIAVQPSEDLSSPDEVGEALQQELADSTLELQVELAVLTAVGLDAQQLDVEAADGTVSVGGSLTSEDEKAQALAAAEGVEGVAEVIDLVQVAQPVVTEEQS